MTSMCVAKRAGPLPWPPTRAAVSGMRRGEPLSCAEAPPRRS
ncbi:hypothetical protein ACFPM0_23645 [Pseudonocardia sulfidoxydans]